MKKILLFISIMMISVGGFVAYDAIACDHEHGHKKSCDKACKCKKCNDCEEKGKCECEDCKCKKKKHKSHSSIPHVNAATVETLQKGGAVVIDSRGGKYFNGEVIKGAKQLSAKEMTEEAIKKIVPNKDTPIVFYCTNTDCPASTFGAHKAESYGYKNVFEYKAGIEDWKSLKKPTENIK